MIGPQTVPVKVIGLGNTEEEILDNTLIQMKRIIQESFSNWSIRQWAEGIVEGLENQEVAQLESVFYYLTNHVSYLRDPHNVELIKTPPIIMCQIFNRETPQLDCDDMTVLILSIVKAIGFPVAMRVISTGHSDLHHVYGLAKVGERVWYPLDLTKPEKGFGWEYPKATKIRTIMVD